MAEIRVEKKKTNIWPWVIGLVLAALLIWGIASRNTNGDRSDAVNRTSSLQPAPITLTVEALAA